jgi:hypothetical protein
VYLLETELEHKLLSSYKHQIIAYMNSHPETFDEAIELALSDKQPYSWRAAYTLWSVIKENDKRIQKHIKRIFNAVKNKKDGHQRELLKILLRMDLDERYESKLFDICMSLWEQINNTPSVRYNAFKFILKIANKHPELKQEISFITQDHYLEPLSPGAKHSIKKLMNQLTH